MRPRAKRSALAGIAALGCALAWGGLVVPLLKPLYDYAWFVGFFVAGAAHIALTPRPAAGFERATVPE